MKWALRCAAWVVLGTLSLQAAWVLALPPFRGSDEFDHAFRAAGVASGQWRLESMAESGRGMVVRVPRGLVEAASGQCESLPYTGEDNCRPIEERADGHVAIATAAGAYNPVYYWVVGTAGSWVDDAISLYAMRTASIGLILLLLFLAVGSVVLWAPGPWARLGLLISLTPTLLYTSVVVAPNGVEIVAGLGFWAALMGLSSSTFYSRGGQSLLVLTAVLSGVVLTGVRTLGPLFVTLIVIAVLLVNRREVPAAVRRHRAAFAVVAGAVIGAAVAALWWSRSAQLFGAAPFNTSIGSSWGSAMRVPEWIFGQIAVYPYRDQPGPALAFVLVLLAAGGAIGLAVVRSPRRWVLLSLVLMSQVVPVLLVLATLQTHGGTWQGRYFLPFSVILCPLAGALLDAAPRRPVFSGLGRLALWMPVGAMAVCIVDLRHDELLRSVSESDPNWVRGPAVVYVLLVVLGLAAWDRALTGSHMEARRP